MATKQRNMRAIICAFCKKTFHISAERHSEDKRRFCSQSCAVKKHGKSHSPEHLSWKGMRLRCLYPSHQNYRLYGGRGIKVCERWLHSFPNFLADMGEKPTPKHTIDRIDPDGNYEPGNCRWATMAEQADNKRTTRHLSFNGTTRNLNTWARHLDISTSTLNERIKRDWPLGEIFDPTKRQGRANRRFTDSQISIAKELLFLGVTAIKVTELTGVGRGCIQNMQAGKSHRSIPRAGLNGVDLDVEARAQYERYLRETGRLAEGVG